MYTYNVVTVEKSNIKPRKVKAWTPYGATADQIDRRMTAEEVAKWKLTKR
jgi:hypothetical protein